MSLREKQAASGLALEASLLQKVAEVAGPHPNLVTMHSTFLAGEHARLALDLADGDLFEFLWRRRGELPLTAAIDFGRQLASGLAHLHLADIAHRDLKLSNALLFLPALSTDRPLIKIADLGLGVHASMLTPVGSLAISPSALALLESGRPRGVSREPYGTVTTMAPEVHSRRWYCPFASDLWSLGVCLLTLAAPREYDEYECDRTPFYPFREPADYDDDYAAFIAPRAPTTTPVAPRRGVPSSPPPGLGMGLGSFPLPPGLGGGLGVGGGTPFGTPPPPGLLPPRPPTTASRVLGLIERRARLYGLAVPEPPLPRALLELLDGLLVAHTPDARLSAAAAAERLGALCATLE